MLFVINIVLLRKNVHCSMWISACKNLRIHYNRSICREAQRSLSEISLPLPCASTNPIVRHRKSFQQKVPSNGEREKTFKNSRNKPFKEQKCLDKRLRWNFRKVNKNTYENIIRPLRVKASIQNRISPVEAAAQSQTVRRFQQQPETRLQSDTVMLEKYKNVQCSTSLGYLRLY